MEKIESPFNRTLTPPPAGFYRPSARLPAGSEKPVHDREKNTTGLHIRIEI